MAHPTPKNLEILPPGLHRDKKESRLFLEVHPSGSRVWKIQAELPRPKDKPVGTRGKTIRRTIGRAPAMGLEDARKVAAPMLEAIRKGRHPDTLGGDASEMTIRGMYEHNRQRMQLRRLSREYISDVETTAERHLDKWMDWPMAHITPTMCHRRYVELLTENGPGAARGVFKYFRVAWNASRKLDRTLPECPTVGITWAAKERDKKQVAIPVEDLPAWWAHVLKLSPNRSAMHRLGLLSGLRPSNLVNTRIEWLDIEAERPCVHYPRLKSSRRFDMPVSKPMADIIREALAVLPGRTEGLLFFPEEHPEEGRNQRWRQRQGPRSKLITGKPLRDTYISLAARLGIDPVHRELLVDHKLGGLPGVYIEERLQWDALLAAQERISAYILGLVGTKDNDYKGL